MAGDCAHSNAHYSHTERFCPSKTWSDPDRDMESTQTSQGRGHSARWSPNFEVIDGLLYRKKLERGFINYREVLDEDRRQEAIGTFHRRRPDQRHLSLEETYKSVADNYWWDGMYFHIKDFVLNCPQCKSQHNKKLMGLGSRACVTKTMASYSSELLTRLKSQRDAGLFCDITLRTSGRSYSAHRAVLAAVSFSEDNLVSLLEFSYSSTLSVRREDLPEVVTLARHLGMWPAVEACCALMKEQERPPFIHHTPLRPCRNLSSSFGRQRKRGFGFPDSLDESFSLTLEASDESTELSPRRILRQTQKRQGHNGLPLSASPRMKLMDFKSPSSKKPTYLTVSPTHTQVQRFLPQSENSPRYKKTHSTPQHSCSPRTKPSVVCSPVRVKQEAPDVQDDDEEDYERAQEKYQLMHVLGLQRTALLPRPEDLVGWRQKKRLRKLKANNYSLTKRRKPRVSPPVLPYKGVTLALPLCNPVNVHLLSKTGKSRSVNQITTHDIVKKTKGSPRHIPPTDRSMRSKGVVPDMFQPPSRLSCGVRELRELVRKGEGTHLRSQRPVRHNNPKISAKHSVRIKPEPAEYSISGVSRTTLQRTEGKSKGTNAIRMPRYNSSRPTPKAKLRQESAKGPKKTSKVIEDVKNNGVGGRISDHSPASIYSHALYKVIKEEPAEPIPVGHFCDPPSPDLGKRQSKPPIKLLDSGFLFSFCRAPGGPMGLKKEEESVDICLTRSVARFRGETNHRALRARPPAPVSTVKREKVNRRLTQLDSPNARKVHKLPKPALPNVTLNKKGNVTMSGRNCVILDSVHRARLKQLRGPRSQAPKAPKSAHVCPQCPASYRDCDALMTHRLRHVEGKHWPCPLCSKTFFRLRNVRNHIRTHDPKLYKCRSCITMGSCG
ncbi:hypothetical protein WMY93_002575 [Mugilogobius chulae]|uniref:Uncharacterized protein n=1 Tax=Mugilogobius chulae TaxID=88201 RepID=A0AAW0PWZ5_9GOBI